MKITTYIINQHVIKRFKIQRRNRQLKESNAGLIA